MSTTLHILGAGTIDLAHGFAPASHLVEAGGRRLLIDSGPGALLALARLNVDPSRLDALWLSHLHLDHLADLWPLLFRRLVDRAGHGPGSPPPGPLPVHVPAGTADRLARAADALYPRLATEVSWREQPADGRGRDLDGLPWRAAAWPAAHSQGARLLRLEGADGALCYSGDTAPCPQLVDAARDAEVLLVECSAPRPVAGHLDPAAVADVLRAARPRRCALVHLSERWTDPEQAADAVRRLLGDSATEVLPGRDGLTLRWG